MTLLIFVGWMGVLAFWPELRLQEQEAHSPGPPSLVNVTVAVWWRPMKPAITFQGSSDTEWRRL